MACQQFNGFDKAVLSITDFYRMLVLAEEWRGLIGKETHSPEVQDFLKSFYEEKKKEFGFHFDFSKIERKLIVTKKQVSAISWPVLNLEGYFEVDENCVNIPGGLFLDKVSREFASILVETGRKKYSLIELKQLFKESKRLIIVKLHKLSKPIPGALKILSRLIQHDFLIHQRETLPQHQLIGKHAQKRVKKRVNKRSVEASRLCPEDDKPVLSKIEFYKMLLEAAEWNVLSGKTKASDEVQKFLLQFFNEKNAEFTLNFTFKGMQKRLIVTKNQVIAPNIVSLDKALFDLKTRSLKLSHRKPFFKACKEFKRILVEAGKISYTTKELVTTR